MALWSVLGQDSLLHIASVYPAANGYLALIRQCLESVCYMLPTALGIEMVSVCTGPLGTEGRVSASVDTRL